MSLQKNGFDPLYAYEPMFLIRRTEQEIASRYHNKKMRCPTHLSIGQEAAATGVILALQPSDHVYSTHRSHAHYIAKGGDLDSLIAELYGKATGCAGGWGGSMHLVDESVGFMGTSAIVGSSIAIAIGTAMGFKRDSSGRAAVAFFGDAAVETGVFWESVNFAALHHLPILWVCENNGYSTATPIRARQPDTPLTSRVSGFGVSASRADDVCIEDLYAKAMLARGQLPAFLEVSSYRYLEHVGPNPDWDMGYRTKEEVERHMATDPVKALRQRLMDQDLGSRVEAIEQLVEDRVLSAFAKAETAPWPTWRENGMIDMRLGWGTGK